MCCPLTECGTFDERMNWSQGMQLDAATSIEWFPACINFKDDPVAQRLSSDLSLDLAFNNIQGVIAKT